MNIGKSRTWCSECAKSTMHLFGTSMLKKAWKECLECGKTSDP